jgi:hypothetical protein
MAYLSQLGRSREGGGEGPSPNLIPLPPHPPRGVVRIGPSRRGEARRHQAT